MIFRIVYRDRRGDALKEATTSASDWDELFEQLATVDSLEPPPPTESLQIEQLPEAPRAA